MNNNDSINIKEEKLTKLFSYILNTGFSTIKPELKSKWYDTLINDLNNEEIDINYQLANFLAASLIMLKLSNNESIEDTYDLIDIQSHQCVFNDLILTGWQNYYITKLITRFHERGIEFSNYRSQKIKTKQKAI